LHELSRDPYNVKIRRRFISWSHLIKSADLVLIATLEGLAIVRRRSPNESLGDELELVREMMREGGAGASTRLRHNQQHTRELEISQASKESLPLECDLRDVILQPHVERHWTRRRDRGEAGSKSASLRLAQEAEREECRPL
jgi:hypothetical protein